MSPIHSETQRLNQATSTHCSNPVTHLTLCFGTLHTWMTIQIHLVLYQPFVRGLEKTTWILSIDQQDLRSVKFTLSEATNSV